MTNDDAVRVAEKVLEELELFMGEHTGLFRLYLKSSDRLELVDRFTAIIRRVMPDLPELPKEWKPPFKIEQSENGATWYVVDARGLVKISRRYKSEAVFFCALLNAADAQQKGLDNE